MPITHYGFRALPFEQQLAAIWQQGTFLATRWEEEDAINLYHMGTFFAEVYYDPDTNELLRTGAFTSVGPLENYTCYVQLHDLPL